MAKKAKWTPIFAGKNAIGHTQKQPDGSFRLRRADGTESRRKFVDRSEAIGAMMEDHRATRPAPRAVEGRPKTGKKEEVFFGSAMLGYTQRHGEQYRIYDARGKPTKGTPAMGFKGAGKAKGTFASKIDAIDALLDPYIHKRKARRLKEHQVQAGDAVRHVYGDGKAIVLTVERYYPTKEDADGPLPRSLLRGLKKKGGSAAIAKDEKGSPFVVYYQDEAKDGAPLWMRPAQYKRAMEYEYP